MCGIAGFRDRTGQFGSPARLDAMLRAISHRGPDDSGTFYSDGTGIGMNRLAIVDIAGGNQPISSPDGRYTIVFNGEIYNFHELKNSLNYPFKTQTDTEVILAGYAIHGVNFFPRLNGIFALCIHDNDSGDLVLARDPIGVKPLYYYSTPELFAFGSEIKSLTQTKVSTRCNWESATQFLASGYVFAPDTAVENIRQLQPGNVMLVLANNVIDVRPYRKDCWESSGASQGDAVEVVREQLCAAVSRQMLSDVPVGLLLSSGLDSMSILAALKNNGQIESLKTYTAYFENQAYSENTPILDLSKKWGFENHQLLITGQDVLASLDGIFDCFDNLELLPTSIAIYLLSQYAGKSSKVLLSGNGSDEFLLGYPTYVASRLAQRFPYILKYFVQGIRPLSSLSTSKLGGYLPLRERFWRFCSGFDPNPELAHLQWRHVFTVAELNKLLHKSGEHCTHASDLFATPLAILEEGRENGLQGLELLSYVDSKVWMVDCGLIMWDKAGMAGSSEIRVPFLDLEFLANLQAIPMRQRGYPLMRKEILRKAFADTLPSSILKKPKQGFQAPVRDWIKGALRTRLQELTFSLPKDRVDHQYIERLWGRFDNDLGDHALQLWALGSLAGWASAHDISL